MFGMWKLFVWLTSNLQGLINGLLGVYVPFQAILKFYKNIRIFNFMGHRDLLWSSKYTNKLKELFSWKMRWT